MPAMIGARSFKARWHRRSTSRELRRRIRDTAPMRPSGPSLSATAPSAQPATPRSDWATLRRLFPYLWRYRWRVGIAPLDDPNQPPERILLLHDAAVSTSGDAERFVIIDGKRRPGDKSRLRNILLLFVLHVHCRKLICQCPLVERVRMQFPGIHKQFELRAP